MKKKIVCLLLIVLLCGCSLFKESDSEKFKSEYESYNGEKTSNDKDYLILDIDEDNIIKYSTLKEVLEIVKNGTGVIYLGFPECPWCRNMVPVLFEAASATSLEEIYYVNMLELRDTKKVNDDKEVVTDKEASSEYYDLLKELNDILPDYTLTDKDGNLYETGEKRIYVPIVLFVFEGNVVGYHANTVESQTDPYVALDDTQKEELINIYLENIHKVLNDTCEDNSEGC